MNEIYEKVCCSLFIFFMNYHYSHGACESLTSTITTNVTCRYNGITLENCTNPVEETIAIFSCKPFYEDITILIDPIRLCKEGKWNGSIPQCYPTCGNKRLHDESFSNISLHYPWHVGIYYRKSDYRCSGTLIDTNIVLTNARCVGNGFPGEAFPAEYFSVAAGKYYSGYDDQRDKFAQYAEILEIHVPERYAALSNRYMYDIAVLILKNPFSLSLLIQPACIDLNEKTENSNELVSLHGIVPTWVHIFRPPTEEKYFDDLRELTVTLLPYEQCIKNLDIPIANLVTYDKLCGDISGCYDHQGGGLVSKNILNDKYYIKAIVHAGWSRLEDCSKHQNSLFNLIGFHTDFVKNYAHNNYSQKYCQLSSFPLNGEYILCNNSDVLYEPEKNVLPHTKIALNCKAGHEIETPDANQFYCLNNGEWAPALKTCTEKPFHYMYIIIIAVTTVLLIVTSIAIKIFYTRKCTSKIHKNLKFIDLEYFLRGDLKRFNPELGIQNQTDLLPYHNGYEFPRDKLKLGKRLGSGAFGIVVKAEATGIIPNEEKTTVAVKMLKETTDYIYWKALVSELKIMHHLGKHINVVMFLGACTKNLKQRELFVIVEYCRFGNLYNYLLENRNNYIDQVNQVTGQIEPLEFLPSVPKSVVGDSKTNNVEKSQHSKSSTASTLAADEVPISNSSSRKSSSRSYKQNTKVICTKDLISWAFQIALGMEYLASKEVLHGDLAARNVLLADNNIVKICDFGLAKQLYKCSIYKKQGDTPLPIKWMAIESIRDRIFSVRSDVWSYGILLWEIFSLAQIPYPEVPPDERLYKMLLEGYRMTSPVYASKEIYKIMYDCWDANPLARPSFSKLVCTTALMLEENDQNQPTQNVLT